MSSSALLAVLGFPCSPNVWREFLGPDANPHLLPLSQVIKSSENAHPFSWAKVVQRKILESKPNVVVAHDVGVTLTLTLAPKTGAVETSQKAA